MDGYETYPSGRGWPLVQSSTACCFNGERYAG